MAGEIVHIPDLPEISSFITLGFNATVRHLELLSALSRPTLLAGSRLENDRITSTSSETFSAVFVCRESLPTALTASLPLLAATASLAHPEQPHIRLIPLRKDAGEQIAKVLGIPRLGIAGLKRGASGAIGLTQLIQQKVQVTEVPWLQEAKIGTYLPVNVKQTEADRGHKEQRGKTSRLRQKTKQPAQAK